MWLSDNYQREILFSKGWSCILCFNNYLLLKKESSYEAGAVKVALPLVTLQCYFKILRITQNCTQGVKYKY